MTEEAKHPLPEGTVVRATARSESNDPDMDAMAAREGAEYKVCAYAASDDPSNDDPGGRAYYMLDDEFTIGGSHWAYEEHVEVVRTVEQLAARELPGPKALARVVSSGLHHAFGSDDVEFFETEVDDNVVTAHGKTSEGLRFGCRVSVQEVWPEEDW